MAQSNSLNPLFIGSWFSPQPRGEPHHDQDVLIPFLSGRGSLRAAEDALCEMGGS